MKSNILTASVVGLFIAGIALPVSAAPENYRIDSVHSMVLFRIKRSDVSYVYGRFNNPEGTLVVDADNPAGDAFTVQVATENVDTGNGNRDNHLRSPDFFNAQQFRTISFKSTSVAKTEDKKYEVTGQLSLHGVEKEIKVVLEETGRGEARGRSMIGFEGKFTIKRSDFGMSGMMGMIGDEVTLIVSFLGQGGN